MIQPSRPRDHDIRRPRDDCHPFRGVGLTVKAGPFHVSDPLLPFAQPTQRSITDTALSDGAFRVLMVLVLHKGPDNWCNPSQGTIGALLGRTRQAIQRHLKELVRLGYVEHRTIKLPNKTSQSDYRILGGVQLPVARGCNDRLQGVQLKAPKGSNRRLQEVYPAKAEGDDTPPLRLVGGDGVSQEDEIADRKLRESEARIAARRKQ